MGYDVHITRKDEWCDEDGPQISQDEWRSYVESDSDLKITGMAEHTTANGETIRLTSPLLTEWRRHSTGSTVWFAYHNGNLTVKNPDEECLEKIRKIASKLNARVQGDEGEFYDEIAEAPQTRPKPSLLNRLTGFVMKNSAKLRETDLDPAILPFKVGDRVCDPWGNKHTVIEIDPNADHGVLGRIRTRRDDGTEHSSAMIAHGFTRIDKE